MIFQKAPDIQKQLAFLIKNLPFPYLRPNRVIAFRSFGSRARARARIWSFPQIWQLALDVPPAYCIEILSEHFDSLSPTDKTKVLIHELMHIPKTFSGALLPHRNRGRQINAYQVEKLFRVLQNEISSSAR